MSATKTRRTCRYGCGREATAGAITLHERTCSKRPDAQRVTAETFKSLRVASTDPKCVDLNGKKYVEWECACGFENRVRHTTATDTLKPAQYECIACGQVIYVTCVCMAPKELFQ